MVGYTKEGKTIEPDSLDCFAKNNEKLYFIRTDRQYGRLFDPYDALGDVGTKQTIKGTGIERCPFISVNQATYNLYISYLKERNNAYITQANRLLRGEG